MKFDTTRTAVAVLVVYGLFATTFFLSPMPVYAVSVVLGVLVVFGALIFAIGTKYGEYRALEQKVA